MPSTINALDRLSRFNSPTPVEPAEPTSLSKYRPAPRMGESPTRPGIFHDKPEVVVVQPRSPWVSSTEQWIVPVTRLAMYSRTKAATFSSGGGSQSSLGSRVSFQCSQICRASSVSRLISGKPWARANRGHPRQPKGSVASAA